MIVDKKILPAPKPSYNDERYANSDTVKLEYVSTVDVHSQQQSQHHQNSDQILVFPYLNEETQESSKNVIVYFHGNGEDLGHTQYLLDVIQSETRMNVLAIEYVGYGTYKCGSPPSADQIKLDSLRIFDYLVEELKIPAANIVLFGRSFGTGPVCFLASERHPAAVVLLSGFTSVKELLTDLHEKVEERDFVERFNNLALIEKMTSPCLLIHGQKDDRINFAQSVKLENALRKGDKQVKAVYPADMTNNQFDVVEDITTNINSFLAQINLLNTPIKYADNPLAIRKQQQQQQSQQLQLHQQQQQQQHPQSQQLSQNQQSKSPKNNQNHDSHN